MVLKVWPTDPGVPKTLLGDLQGQNYFHNKTKTLSALFLVCVDMYTYYTKEIVHKIAEAFA